jgi:GDP-L-fucose synthase
MNIFVAGDRGMVGSAIIRYLMREFLNVSDMAAASVPVMTLDNDTYSLLTKPMLSHINVGTGMDCTIRELAETFAKVTGFKGQLVFDCSKPDGTPRKLMDVSRLKSLGWQLTTSLEAELRDTYQWFEKKLLFGSSSLGT